MPKTCASNSNRGSFLDLNYSSSSSSSSAILNRASSIPMVSNVSSNFFSDCAIQKYFGAKMFKTYVIVEGLVPVFEVNFFFLINTIENYILKHFNNTNKKEFLHFSKKKIDPLNCALFFL